MHSAVISEIDTVLPWDGGDPQRSCISQAFNRAPPAVAMAEWSVTAGFALDLSENTPESRQAVLNRLRQNDPDLTVLDLRTQRREIYYAILF